MANGEQGQRGTGFGSGGQGFGRRANPAGGAGPTADEAAGSDTDETQTTDLAEGEEAPTNDAEQETGPVGRPEICNECGQAQDVNFGEHNDAARQWRCTSCGAVNTARFPENTEGGVEREIQGRQFEEAVLSQEDQARQAVGDEAVDQTLQKRQARQQAAQDHQEAASADEDADDEVEEDEEP